MNKDNPMITIDDIVDDITYLTKDEIETITGKEISKDAYDFSNGSIEKVIEFSNDESYEVAKEISKLLEK